MIELTETRMAEIARYVHQAIWTLNPSGNLEKVIQAFCEMEKAHAPHTTADTAGQRYIDYFNKWSYEHDGQDERYIGKEDKLIDVYTFLLKRMYQNEYAIQKKSRDFYLFGMLSREELKARHQRYQSHIAHGRK